MNEKKNLTTKETFSLALQNHKKNNLKIAEKLYKEILNIDGKTYNTLRFNFSSTDQKLDKDKKLNTDVWYDEKTLNWIKASFKKKGNWEYKLSSIK